MRTIAELVLVSLLAFSSAFFIGDISQGEFGSIKTAEAMCAIGQYSNQGADGMTGTPQCGGTTSGLTFQTSVEDSITPIVNVLAAILLALSIISIIYAGYQYMRVASDPRNAEKAKQRLMNTGLAIIVILSIYSIYRLVASLVSM